MTRRPGRLAVWCGLPFAVISAVAGDAPWLSRPLSAWTPQDAFQTLSDSPWSRLAVPAQLAVLSAGQRREAGDLGAGTGGKGGKGFEPARNTGLFGGRESPSGSQTEVAQSRTKVQIRWESALPVRSAELRIGESDAPVLDGDDYAIAIFGVSLKSALVELKGLDETLKRNAVLKVEGRKEMRPSRVAVLSDGSDEAVVVYFFPRALAISDRDAKVDLMAQIGRLFFAQSFFPPQMRMMGKLEL